MAPICRAGTSIASSVTIIALLDTVVAVAAGLAIFPIVFANGLEPSQGPGLMFVTVPLAFGNMPLGALFGTLFFVLVSFAAITSAISISEPALAYLVEEYNAKRSRVAVSLGVISWVLGIGTVLSFNHWADSAHRRHTYLFRFRRFRFPEHHAAARRHVHRPVCAWALPKTVIGAQLGVQDGVRGFLWKVVCGVIAPLAVLIVFVATVFG